MIIPYDNNVLMMTGIGVGRAVRTGREMGVTSIKAGAEELGT
jgi:hypothetical protein